MKKKSKQVPMELVAPPLSCKIYRKMNTFGAEN